MTKLSKLFRQRWRDKCDKPCPSPDLCSCLNWAKERAEPETMTKSYDVDHDLAALLRRAAAGIETPADLTEKDKQELVEDLLARADEEDEGAA